jgi:putative nucleotidyltransferase with HDIG domain
LLDSFVISARKQNRPLFLQYVRSAATGIDRGSPIYDLFHQIWPAIAVLIRSKRSHQFESLNAEIELFAHDTHQVMDQYSISRLTGTQETFDEIDALIETLVAKLDVSSPFTAEHSRAVSAWASRIARNMSLSEDECTMARRGGLIHDIGKAATPSDILDAPRALTETEWVIMRNHTTSGAAMLEARETLADLIPAVRNHHERLDGKGYPDGLGAADLSIVVRIISVADCFNAMVGRRPYRAPMPPTRALEELLKHRGTQFDPDVVEAMIKIVNG